MKQRASVKNSFPRALGSVLALSLFLLTACGDEGGKNQTVSDSLTNTPGGGGINPGQASNVLKKEAPATLRILSYNIKSIPCVDDGAAKAIAATVAKKCPLNDDAWSKTNDNRMAFIAGKIRELASGPTPPDVVLIQEAWYSKNSLFTNPAVRRLPALSGYPYFAWGPEGTIDNGMGDYWNLVNQNKDKLKGLLNSGLLVLSRYPILGKESALYGPECASEDCHGTKGALLVRISAPSIGTVDVVNTHVQAETPYAEIRKKQYAVLANLVKNANLPFTFMGGDFNAPTNPEFPEMTTLMGLLPDLKDGGKTCAATAGCAFSGNAAEKLKGAILDHVFSKVPSPFLAKVKSATIYDWPLPNSTIEMSDHKPIMVEYQLTLEP